jgi:putative pyruvate formate lyase activating enzyme
MLGACRLCGWRCGADRTQGPAGACHADAVPRLHGVHTDWAGEADLTPMMIVGVSGCNMRCSFCNAMPSSQNAQDGGRLDMEAIGAAMATAVPGLRAFSVLGGEPTIHFAAALEIAAHGPPDLPFVWKTNAYASPEALSLLEGVVDVVLADLKFGNDACAERLAGVPRYGEVVLENIRWACSQPRLIVRHLLMPGHLECCFEKIVRRLAAELPGAELSLMDGYLPAHLAASDPLLGRTVTPDEAARARQTARELGLRLVPWHIATVAGTVSHEDGAQNEIWIDRHGRVCAHGASGALTQCLRALNHELGTGA